MERMTQAERDRWMNGTRAEADAVMAAVKRGLVQCDGCDEPAVSVGHKGAGATPHALCGGCFIADVEESRRTRPSRDELIARVNAAVGL